MLGSGQQLRDHGLTLEDYLAHQRTLRSLQQSQPVWMFDELLGLRYRAHLQLCLAPARHLLLTDESTVKEYNNAQKDLSGELTSLTIPLSPTCQIDVCETDSGVGDVLDGEKGIRFTFTPPLPLESSPADTPAEEIDVSYCIIPICDTVDYAAAVTHAWAAVLRFLCQPPTHRLNPTRPAAAAAAPAASHHADPRSAETLHPATSVPPSASRRGQRPERGVPHFSEVDARQVKPSNATSAPSLSFVNGTASVGSIGAAAAISRVSLPVTTAPTPVSAPTQRTAASSANAAQEPPHQSSVNTNPTGSNGHRKEARPRDERQPQQPLQQQKEEETTTAFSRRQRSDEPPPLHPALSDDQSSADPHQQRLLRLTALLRGRTSEASHLTTEFRTSLSPGRASLSREDDTLPEAGRGAGSVWEVRDGAAEAEPPLTDVVVVDARDANRTRPPTIAHTSSGLVPALTGFAAHVGSDDEEEEEEENDSTAAGAATAGQRIGHGHRHQRHSVGVVDSGSAPLADSPRPQAPRSGHVCDLGSLGPSRGDEEALRMYNEIHGSRSSSSSSAAGSTASSFPSSAYETPLAQIKRTSSTRRA